MELYRGKVNTVELEIPATATTVSATASINGETPTVLILDPPTIEEPDIRTTALPFANEECSIVVALTFTIGGKEYTSNSVYQVVTPYLSTRWIKKNLLTDATDQEIKEAEAAARYIINSHTGQSFGAFTGAKVVPGNGETALELPARLVILDSLNVEGYTAKLFDTTTTVGFGQYVLAGDGWYLKNLGYVGGIDEEIEVIGVIYNPFSHSNLSYKKDLRYVVSGTWGWSEVPEPVVEAMKLLVNDYAAMDSIYRDKYLTSLTSPDWRIQFAAGAFARTGNVRADQLLADFVVKRGWAII